MDERQMSTKIYQAYRAPAEYIVDLIDWGRDTMETAAMVWLERLMENIDPEKLGECPEHIAGDPEGEKVWERAKRLETVMELVKEEVKSPYKSVLNINCGMNLWFYAGKVYMIPIGERFIVEELDKSLPEWLEDYSYWNNTDPPEEITDEQWRERGETWDQICTGKGRAQHNARRLYHEVIDAGTSMGSFDLEWKMGKGDMWEWADKARKKHQEARK